MNGLQPMILKRSVALVLLWPALSGWAFAADADEPDAKGAAAVTAGWPNWRGPSHDGVSAEKIVAWPAEGPRQLWTAEVGPGHAAPSVRGDKVFIMGRARKEDVVYCFNADTGAVVWKFAYEAAESAYGRGPRATPAVEGNAVYTVSADGQVFCLDAASGRPIWNRNFHKELNLPMPRNHFSTSPVLDGELLLLNMGTSGLALDKKTGNVVWKSEGDSSYSSPVPFNLGGRRCVALFAAHELVVVDEADGRKLAAYEWKLRDNTNCADPVIVGDTIFISSSYGRGCALVRVNGDEAAAVWRKGYACYYASPVLVGDCLYALVDSGWMKADLVCISVKDGSEKWRQKGVGSGGLVVADGKLVILSRGGELILTEASPDAYKEIARARVLPAQTGGARPSPIACWNGPVLSGGRIYARNERGTLVCVDVRGR